MNFKIKQGKYITGRPPRMLLTLLLETLKLNVQVKGDSTSCTVVHSGKICFNEVHNEKNDC